MTSSVIRKYALAALCGAAIVSVGQSAQAATWDINDPPAVLAGPANYGTGSTQNNVVNQIGGGAGVFDTFNGATIFANANLRANFASSYTVSWTYLGSESNNIIQFTGPGVAGFNETNANNNCASGAPTCFSFAPSGTVPMGSIGGQTAVLPLFSFKDVTPGGDGSTVANGANNPVPPPNTIGFPNFLMSFAIFQQQGDPLWNAIFGDGLYLTSSVTDIVVIGLNDTGAADDNHDDFMLAAFISELPGESNVPIPGALPLFASVLGGGFLFRRLRNRRQAKAVA